MRGSAKHTRMEVQLFPNRRCPGVGLKPRRESQRPLLPQHARHCPVLEAGSTLGFLVYPPLQPSEAFHVGYEGEGRYRFVYLMNPSGRKWKTVFAVSVALPVGSFGMFKEEVTFMPGMPTTSPDVAVELMGRFVVGEDLGTPAGAITLRGGWNFQTQAGWDTVYSPVFNAIERPVAPMLVVRVETDWYAHESEFRYVLQPGERLSVEHSMPIGQVFFVPREPVTLRDCSERELSTIRQSQERFSDEKALLKVTTPYGLPYSPHYLRKSRSQNAGGDQSAHEETSARERNPETSPAEQVPTESVRIPIVQTVPAPMTPAPQTAMTTRTVGRNEPCPCGSGKKYKKCHGQG